MCFALFFTFAYLLINVLCPCFIYLFVNLSTIVSYFILYINTLITLPLLQIPQGYCYVARLTAIKYLSFLQKLSKSNKIGYRAFALDIITECMSEEWLWSVPLKSTDMDIITGNNVTDNSNFYARSLLSMVRHCTVLFLAFSYSCFLAFLYPCISL